MAYPDGRGTALSERIASLLAAPEASRAHWGIAVTALDGTPLYGLDEGKLFRPASTAKLFTTAAALAVLGPEKRFTTVVEAVGTLDGGRLHGDLVLRGGGDANFGSHDIPYLSPAERAARSTPPGLPLADIEGLADRIAATGMTSVDGDLVGDDSYFEDTRCPEGWSAEDLLWGYGAPVSALTVHDNQIDLTVPPPPDPKASLTKLPIILSPDLPYYRVNPPQPERGATGAVYSQDFGRNQVLIERAPGSRDLLVVGDVATKYGPERDEIAIDEPAEYAALALRAALLKRGIAVHGRTRTRHWDSGFVGSFLDATLAPDPMVLMSKPEHFFQPTFQTTCEAQRAGATGDATTSVLAEQQSPAFADDVRFTLKASENLHAEVMLRHLAAARDCEHTLRRSLQIMRQYVLWAGVSGDDFRFYDGSGLSVKDVVTPRAETQLLAFAVRQPWFAPWKASLPVGGVDGTLAGRFKEAPGVSAEVARLKGRIFAKTGTLGESRALAGYVECASGKTVIFSVMVDNHLPGTSGDREVMDKIVAAIAATQ